MTRAFGTLVLSFVLFVSGGATCARRPASVAYPPPPTVFDTIPTLDQVVEVVNRTANVTELSTNSASVEMLSQPSLPRLSATMNLRRDRDFRLRASIPILLGMGLDMGSNSEMFWFEVPEGATFTKTLYYANHQQYQQQLDRAILPVDPTWIMDALGLAQIDISTVVAGPIERPDGKLQIRTSVMSPIGPYQRDLMIQRSAGYITDQYLYDPSGQLVAQSQASNHVYYSPQQCALPHRVDLNLVQSGGPPLAMRIEISDYTVNQLLSGDPNLFAMPNSASRVVDLTTLSGGPPVPGYSVTPPSSVPDGPVTYTADATIANPIRGTAR